MLRPLDPRCEVVQFNSLPSEKDLLRLANLMESRPDVALRAYGGYDGTIDNLEFLRFFPQLTRFHADALRYRKFNDIDGLRYLPDNLLELSVGNARAVLPTPAKVNIAATYCHEWRKAWFGSAAIDLDDLCCAAAG
jgi:hypothetical protein